jgi:hypothetical protein
MSAQPRWRRFAAFAIALGSIVTFLALAEQMSPQLPGPAGELFRRNVEEDIEATALIYTESHDVREYLDTEHGRYR